jgi:hypothetical protein
MGYDQNMRSFWVLVVVGGAAVSATSGCHLIFPFGHDGAPDGGAWPADGSSDVAVPDLTVPLQDQGPDRASDTKPPKPDGLKPLKDQSVTPVSDFSVVKAKWTPMTVTGATWAKTSSPRIWGVNASTIYVAAYKTIYHCLDDTLGTLSCNLDKVSPEVIHDLGGLGSEVLAVGQNNLVLSQSNGWKGIYTDAVPYAFYSVWCHSSSQCVLAGKRLSGAQDAVCGSFTAGGFTPQKNGSKQYNGVWRRNNGRWVVVGPGCQLHDFIPGGSWAAHKPCLSANLTAVWGASDAEVHIAGAGGTLLRKETVGYKLLTSPTTADLNALWGADASNVYAVGENGTVLRYNGVGWSKLTKGPFGTNNLTDIWGVNKSRIYVVGPDTKVYRYGL